MAWWNTEMVCPPKTVTHPSTNRARHRVSSLTHITFIGLWQPGGWISNEGYAQRRYHYATPPQYITECYICHTQPVRCQPYGYLLCWTALALLLGWFHTKTVYPQKVTHLSTNWAQHRLISFMWSTPLPLSQATSPLLTLPLRQLLLLPLALQYYYR